MRRVITIAVLLLAVPTIALAQNVGKCGWGSKLFDGQRGIAPQVLAVTTNGTSGNQTFAITSGTSGCTQDGVVHSSWITAAYLDGNLTRFARDVSRGQGETISGLAHLLSIPADQQTAFGQKLQSSFASIFPTQEISSTEVAERIQVVLSTDPQWSAYSSDL